MIFLGIDTSNYTTSVAAYDDVKNEVTQFKKLLPVKKGERGLRQSDAVFHHTVQLPELLEKLTEQISDFSAVGVSVSPTTQKGSYMPCFMTGVLSAVSVSSVCKIPLYRFSHQQGHIMAALYSADKTDLISESFLAFHVSGGTTDLLLVRPSDEKIFDIQRIGGSNDLKAGQAVDRLGVSLGFDFPAGKFVDAESLKSDRVFNVRPSVSALTCSLSGLENKYMKMKADGETNADICRFCVEYIGVTLQSLIENARKEYGDLPVLMSGGVMSNTLIKAKLSKLSDVFFAEPEFSADNAAGIAILAGYESKRI